MSEEEALRQKHPLTNAPLATSTYAGVNRRATALLPPPRNPSTDKLDWSEYSDYRKLFLTIEAHQHTACLRIESEHEKSRSGILIYRGRVLGCIYRNRGLDQYLFGELAYKSAVKDLANTQRIVEAYRLQEDLAIATAALFHGHVLEVPQKASASETFQLTYDYLVESKMPGSIVLSSLDEQSLCMVYLHEGRIIGVYSGQEGWLEPVYGRIKAYLESHSVARAQACILTVRNLSEVLRYTFSLSGLADRSVEAWAHRDKGAIPNVFYLCNHDARILGACDNVVPLDRFIPGRGISQSAYSNRASDGINNAYRVNP